MNHLNNKKLTENSKKLRREMTKQERHLWYDFLKQLPITIHRQKTIGNYIVDFYVAEKRIAIEIDGEEHFSEERMKKDSLRTAELNKLGIRVIRYTNRDVTADFENVCDDIYAYIFLDKED